MPMLMQSLYTDEADQSRGPAKDLDSHRPGVQSLSSSSRLEEELAP